MFDWSVHEGYFTDRGQEIPPGTEETSDEVRREREEQSLERIREYGSEPHPDEPDPHPDLRTESSNDE